MPISRKEPPESPLCMILLPTTLISWMWAKKLPVQIPTFDHYDFLAFNLFILDSLIKLTEQIMNEWRYWWSVFGLLLGNFARRLLCELYIGWCLLYFCRRLFNAFVTFFNVLSRLYWTFRISSILWFFHASLTFIIILISFGFYIWQSHNFILFLSSLILNSCSSFILIWVIGIL